MEPDKALGGVLLFWSRGHCSSLRKLVPVVIREICAYFDARRLPDVAGNRLWLYEMESRRRVSFPLSIKTKGRPPLVRIEETVLIFACGWASTYYAGKKTYRVDFFGKTQSLSSSLIGLAGPAPLYDPETGYIYLFGGENLWGKTDKIQVYDLLTNHWTVIQAELRCARSHFSAVKYQRQVYIMGGSSDNLLEMFDLDTGNRGPVYHLPEATLDSCAGLMREHILIGLFSDCKPLTVCLDTMAYEDFHCGVDGWVGLSNRMWVDKDRIVMILDSGIQIAPILLPLKSLCKHAP